MNCSVDDIMIMAWSNPRLKNYLLGKNNSIRNII